ncbi:TraR/DksA family transcriptional regulator [Jatrophihabitans fulvus]
MRSTTSPRVPATRPGAGLDPRTLAQLRLMLEQQRGFRLEQLAGLAQPSTPERLQGRAHDEITAALAEGARAALRDVTDALARMAEGTYGRCTRCATPLALERLEILPQVALCMSCQRAEAVRGGAG